MADAKSQAIAREAAEAERVQREQQIAQRLDRLLELLEPAGDHKADEKKQTADKPKK